MVMAVPVLFSVNLDGSGEVGRGAGVFFAKRLYVLSPSIIRDSIDAAVTSSSAAVKGHSDPPPPVAGVSRG